jgi:hypothetical protein
VGVEVTLAGPVSIGTCTNLFQLSATASGSNGRPLTYKWRERRPNNLSYAVDSTTRVLNLDARNFTLGTNYELEVNVSNWLGDWDTAVFRFTKDQEMRPALALTGPSIFSVNKNEPVDVRVKVEPDP